MTTAPTSEPRKRVGGYPSFCIYGPSGSGKTPQIGLFSRRLFKDTGGRRKGDTLIDGYRTRIYTADRGGFDSILPEIELGLIQLVDLKLQKEDPWIWATKSIQGRVPNTPGDVKWTKTGTQKDDKGNTIGCWAFEGLTEWGNSLMKDMGDKSSAGQNVGGGVIDTRVTSVDSEGEDFSYAGHTRAHYMMGQDEMDRLISRSMRLSGFLIWTALDLRSNDVAQARQVVGPDIGVGSKMTAKVPQKFTYCWRTVNLAKKGGDSAIYRLYLVTHEDPNITGLTGVCNARYPVDAPHGLKVPFVEPADMAKAYVIAKTARDSAKEAILAGFSS